MVDPTYDEIFSSEQARRYGLTTSEYRKRDMFVRSSSCNYLNCDDAIMWGLSLELYRSRWAMVNSRCGLSDIQKQILNSTPRKDRNSLPFLAELYACQVNTMLGR